MALLTIRNGGRGSRGRTMEQLDRDFGNWDPSGAEELPFAECRATPRRTVMIRPGKLIADGREFLCVVRDVTERGLKVRLFHPLPDHRDLAIEFDNGDRHALRLVWQSGEQAGCGFPEPIDCARLLAAQEGDFPRRQPRLNVELAATLCTGGLRTPVTLRDISQRGASIDCNGGLMIDELVRIECDNLPTVHAKVRWRRPPRYGVVFEQTFRIDDLARVCAGLQQAR